MKAFTLVELIIYIAVVSGVLILITGFALDVIQGNTKVSSYREVQQNARFGLEKIVRALRAGYDPGNFYVSEGILFQQGIALTSDRVRVTNLTISSIANTYRINLSVEHVNFGQRNEYQDSINLNSTVALLPIELPAQNCWGIGGFCDFGCQYSYSGSLTNYYIDPGCSDVCLPAGSFYLNPEGACSDDGSGSCYKMTTYLSRHISCLKEGDCESECLGICVPCRDLNQDQCVQQQGCYWLRKCQGKCVACNNFSDSGTCQDQLGCSWQATKWYWNLDNYQTGYPSLIGCEWYTQ